MSQPRAARGEGSGRGLVAEILDVPYLLITGASSGIGRASVLELTSEFSHVTIIGRDPARHEQLVVESSGIASSVTELADLITDRIVVVASKRTLRIGGRSLRPIAGANQELHRILRTRVE